MRAGLIGQKYGAARSRIGVAVVELLFIAGREVVRDAQRRSLQRQLQHRVAEVAPA